MNPSRFDTVTRLFATRQRAGKGAGRPITGVLGGPDIAIDRTMH